jgi:hypothetical protein
MSAPLRTWRVTFVETIRATVTVEADSTEAASDLALAEYRAEPEAYIHAGGSVRILRCDPLDGEAAS